VARCYRTKRTVVELLPPFFRPKGINDLFPLAVLYWELLGILFLIGYWGVFGFNVFEYISFSDIIFISIVPAPIIIAIVIVMWGIRVFQFCYAFLMESIKTYVVFLLKGLLIVFEEPDRWPYVRSCLGIEFLLERVRTKVDCIYRFDFRFVLILMLSGYIISPYLSIAVVIYHLSAFLAARYITKEKFDNGIKSSFLFQFLVALAVSLPMYFLLAGVFLSDSIAKGYYVNRITIGDVAMSSGAKMQCSYLGVVGDYLAVHDNGTPQLISKRKIGRIIVERSINIEKYSESFQSRLRQYKRIAMMSVKWLADLSNKP